MSLLAALVVLIAVLGVAIVPAAAQEPGDGPKATIELLVGRTTVKPGETFRVGVKFTMQPGWHIYWKNPGDSGNPPRFSWGLPGGGASRMMRGGEWQASEPQFPVPMQWSDAPGLIGYGYGGTVVFPAEVTVPASTTPGQIVELGVTADYMICKDICLQESAGTTVELRIGSDSTDDDETADGTDELRAAQKAIESARQSLPTPAEGAKIETSNDGTTSVSAPVPAGAKNVNFFPHPPTGVAVEDMKVTQTGGTATATFRVRALQGAKPAMGQFEGVFGYDANGGRRGVSVQVPLPNAAGQ